MALACRRKDVDMPPGPVFPHPSLMPDHQACPASFLRLKFRRDRYARHHLDVGGRLAGDHAVGTRAHFLDDGFPLLGLEVQPHRDGDKVPRALEIGELSDLAAWDYASYGVDLIKEEGKWRIWHRVVYTDFATPTAVSWTEKVSEFLAGTANVEGMAKTVDPSLYRNRNHSHETAPATPA